MSKIIGKIDSIDGVFYVKQANGELNKILKDSKIHEGDIIIGDSSNKNIDSLSVSMADGYEDVIVMSNHSQLFDSSLVSQEYSEHDTVTEKETIESIREDLYNDVNIDEIDTASGVESIASSEGGEAVFAEANNDSVNINVEVAKSKQDILEKTNDSNKVDDEVVQVYNDDKSNSIVENVNDAPVAIDDNNSDYTVTLTDTITSNITIDNSDSISLKGKENFQLDISVTPDGEQGNYDIIFNKENTVELAFTNDGHLQFAMRTDDEAWVWHKTDVEYTPNEINNITFSYDGENVTITNTDANGITDSYSKSYTGGIVDYGNDMMIGNRPYGGGRYSMDGEVDDISMSIDGVEVVHLDFEGINPLTDSSGNGNDATLSSGAGLVVNNSIETNEDTSITIYSSEILTNDTDIDGDRLSIINVDANVDTHGTISLDAQGNVLFTPEPNYNGEASFSYTISDGQGGTDTAIVTLNVNSVNDMPTLDVQSTASMDEDGSITISYNASDIDSVSLEVTASSDHGEVHINDNGTLTFTPNDNYNGDANITLQAVDSNGAMKTKNVSVNINALEDSPDAVDDGSSSSIILTDTITSNITIDNSDSISLKGKENFQLDISVTPDGEQGNYDIIFNKENTVELAFTNDGHLQFAMRTDDEAWVWHKTDVEYTPNEINNITFSYDGENVTITNTDANGITDSYSKSYTGCCI
ncbi:tandem-95 repeat protein [Sulfurimonas sp.]|uniref:tandem-95 repeat protein n=1 Tax=Sulfurimonas sp. TaxID=2022749 RepID=UPI002AB17488|nr:tandem-95 repeat protein [Sulfurimonas sp.]